MILAEIEIIFDVTIKIYIKECCLEVNIEIHCK